MAEKKRKDTIPRIKPSKDAIEIPGLYGTMFDEKTKPITADDIRKEKQ